MLGAGAEALVADFQGHHLIGFMCFLAQAERFGDLGEVEVDERFEGASLIIPFMIELRRLIGSR